MSTWSMEDFHPSPLPPAVGLEEPSADSQEAGADPQGLTPGLGAGLHSRTPSRG